ncbi:MAG: sigma-54-dependent Fis family transcriptional regulator [Ectothiorhodospiraceae bacterium]|nr:sigma-54-dependent Fis family transcriptional regulator [Ectothiorhodospiraceae bacterium]
MSEPTALVCDDEADIRELIGITLERMGVAVEAVATLAEARAASRGRTFDLCLTDMRLPDGNGIDLVRHMHQHHPTTPVAMITAHGSMDSAIEALKAGAFDFVSKPVDLQVLRNLVTTALRLGQRKTGTGRELVGDSAAMREVRATIMKLARSQAPVFVSGESGTGKELVARMIHDQGPRADAPFVPVNCGAIPEELMESELFGHRKGSFTGAVADKRGLFQAADGGTLFLDEVAELPLHMQVKLLRAIQEKAVRPVGAEREVAVDVRILSASHRDLDRLVRDERFRQDLYYRLNVINLHVPPLRERPGDVVQLAGHVLERLAQQVGIPPVHLTRDATTALEAYRFPGNVRELENILERAMTLCDGTAIGVADLALPETRGATASPTSTAPEPPAPVTTAAGQPPSAADLDAMLETVEKERIVRALEQVRWNKTAAAKVLGISFGALRYRMQKLGLD